MSLNAPHSSGHPRRNRFVRSLLTSLAGAVVLVVAVLGLVWAALRGSLAKLDGQTRLPGLSAPVLVERDGQGVPTISATNRLDLARTVGFLHGQERFFQMD